MDGAPSRCNAICSPMRTIPESAVWMAAPHSQPKISPLHCATPAQWWTLTPLAVIAPSHTSLHALQSPERSPPRPPRSSQLHTPTHLTKSPNRQIAESPNPFTQWSSPLRILELCT